jgi:membrane protein involved in colicin uptake
LAGLLVFAGVSQRQTAAAETGCSAAERDAYFDAIEARIYENWRIPHTNRTLSCKVLIKQDFRGEVRDVGIALCGEDPAVHRSVMNAAYRASPMPLPANKSCFARSVIVTIESRTQQGD